MAYKYLAPIMCLFIVDVAALEEDNSGLHQMN